MASYPESTGGAEPSSGPATASAPTSSQSPPPQQHHQLHEYDGLPSHIPATTVAHHGLQVLQAASAAQPTPDPADLAQQYAQSAAMQMGDPQFTQSLASPTVAPMPATPASQKVTRLRRACDMCSQRKVKVSKQSLILCSPSLYRWQSIEYSYSNPVFRISATRVVRPASPVPISKSNVPSIAQ